MNMIEIVKNAPEGAERYKFFDCENYAEYYAVIDDVKNFYSVKENKWKECRGSSFDSSLPLPKLKTEWVKVEDSIFELAEDLKAGELYFDFEGDEPDKRAIKTELQLMHLRCNNRPIYRKVEKVIGEKQDFIERASEVSEHHEPTVFGKLYEAGCRFIELDW